MGSDSREDKLNVNIRLTRSAVENVDDFARNNGMGRSAVFELFARQVLWNGISMSQLIQIAEKIKNAE